MTIPIRVINLERSADRRASISRHLGELGLSFTLFRAVDGRKMTAAEIAEMRPGKNPRYRTPLMPGQIGVSASYRRLCLEIADGSSPYVCILEDDVILSPLALALFDEQFLASLPDFDILRFGHGGTTLADFSVRFGKTAAFDLVAPVFPAGMTIAQIVSRAGARRIAAGLIPLHTVVDTHLFNDARVAGLRTLHTVPVLARHAGVSPSTLAEEAWPTVGFWGRFPAKAAQAFAVLRNIASFTAAWGWRTLYQAVAGRGKEKGREDRGPSS